MSLVQAGNFAWSCSTIQFKEDKKLGLICVFCTQKACANHLDVCTMLSVLYYQKSYTNNTWLMPDIVQSVTIGFYWQDMLFCHILG